FATLCRLMCCLLVDERWLRPMKRPGNDSCGLTMRRRSLLLEDGRTQLSQAILDIPGHLTVALGGGLDTERSQQCGGMRRGVAMVAEDGVEAVIGQVVEDEVDHGPGVEGLPLVRRLGGEPARRAESRIGHDTPPRRGAARFPVPVYALCGGGASQFETRAVWT